MKVNQFLTIKNPKKGLLNLVHMYKKWQYFSYLWSFRKLKKAIELLYNKIFEEYIHCVRDPNIVAVCLCQMAYCDQIINNTETKAVTPLMPVRSHVVQPHLPHSHPDPFPPTTNEFHSFPVPQSWSSPLLLHTIPHSCPLPQPPPHSTVA